MGAPLCWERSGPGRSGFPQSAPAARGSDVLLTLTYLTFFTALIFWVGPAWFSAFTVQV